MRSTSPRGRPVIATATGRYIDITNLMPADIHIEDIARGLANTCRFQGQCREFYSVAQHSCLVMELLEGDRNREIEALLHDAGEAFYGDIPRSHKQLLSIRQRSAISSVDTSIAKRFNLNGDFANEVAEADLLALGIEASVFWPETWTEWVGLAKIQEQVRKYRAINQYPKFLSPEQSYKRFMSAVVSLGIE